MAGAKSRPIPSEPAKKSTTSLADRHRSASRVQTAPWPEVLTLPEVADYLRVAQAEIEQVVKSQGLPGRRIGSEWRFSRTAIEDWLRQPSMKDSLLRLAGSWKDDPHLDAMLADIYRQRGRQMTEDSE